MDRAPNGRFLPGHRLAGRATTYQRAIVDRIIEGIAEGGTLPKLCAAEGIGTGAFYSWVSADRDGLMMRLEDARLTRYDLWEEELLEHARAELGSESMAAVTARRVLLDTMKWVMCRRLPAKWSEQTLHQHQVSGGAEVRLYLPIKGSNDDGAREGARRLIEGEAVEIGDS
jgi:hypothetical protein